MAAVSSRRVSAGSASSLTGLVLPANHARIFATSSGAAARCLVLYPQLIRARRRERLSGLPLMSATMTTVADARACAMARYLAEAVSHFMST